MIELEWEYSRNQKCHSLDDGERYRKEDTPDDIIPYLWCIYRCVDKYGYNAEGYDLWHRGQFAGHGKTVKDLKEFVKKVEEENGQYTIF